MVMIRSISTHPGYNDRKWSTETPLSYTQLSYNETLHRYFDSYQPLCHKDCNTVTGENVLDLKDVKSLNRHNAEMEKESVKMHRETRTGNKGEREETRKKKKEHLAQCNATFQPTLAGAETTPTESPVQKGPLQSQSYVPFDQLGGMDGWAVPNKGHTPRKEGSAQ